MRPGEGRGKADVALAEEAQLGPTSALAGDRSRGVDDGGGLDSGLIR